MVQAIGGIKRDLSDITNSKYERPYAAQSLKLYQGHILPKLQQRSTNRSGHNQNQDVTTILIANQYH